MNNIPQMKKFIEESTTETPVILGDTNCNDDSEEDKNKMVKLLRSFYKTYQIKQLITNTTRKTKNTQSIIDHFATNRPEVITKTGTA